MLSLERDHQHLDMDRCVDCGSDQLIRMPLDFTDPIFRARWLAKKLKRIQYDASVSHYLPPDHKGYKRIIPPTIIEVYVSRHPVTKRWVRVPKTGPDWWTLEKGDAHSSLAEADDARLVESYSHNLRLLMPGRMIWVPGSRNPESGG